MEVDSMDFRRKNFLNGVKSYKANEMATAYEGVHSVADNVKGRNVGSTLQTISGFGSISDNPAAVLFKKLIDENQGEDNQMAVDDLIKEQRQKESSILG
jgi:hypothetical protein